MSEGSHELAYDYAVFKCRTNYVPSRQVAERFALIVQGDLEGLTYEGPDMPGGERWVCFRTNDFFLNILEPGVYRVSGRYWTREQEKALRDVMIAVLHIQEQNK